MVLTALGYLVGSIPVAWLIAKLVTGQDMRRLGSGNVGVMDTALSVARWAGLVVLVGEAAKGVLAVTLAQAYGNGEVAVVPTVLATFVGTR